MSAYQPGDRVRSLVPGGDDGSIVEVLAAGDRAWVLWDDNTCDVYPIGLLFPMPDLSLPIGDTKDGG